MTPSTFKHVTVSAALKRFFIDVEIQTARHCLRRGGFWYETARTTILLLPEDRHFVTVYVWDRSNARAILAQSLGLPVFGAQP